MSTVAVSSSVTSRIWQRLSCALDIYEPVANKILSIVAMAFIEEREKVVRQQEEAIRELSTPVLQVRQGLLTLPIIGVLDSLRARQLTEQLLRAIRANRAKVVVLDMTGVPAVDSKVANHLLQTVDACRLMGAKVIVTGLTPEIAQTLVHDRRGLDPDRDRERSAGRHRGGGPAPGLSSDSPAGGTRLDRLKSAKAIPGVCDSIDPRFITGGWSKRCRFRFSSKAIS